MRDVDLCGGGVEVWWEEGMRCSGEDVRVHGVVDVGYDVQYCCDGAESAHYGEDGNVELAAVICHGKDDILCFRSRGWVVDMAAIS